MLRCAHKWLTQTANAAAANTSTIVAMGRFACPVRIVGTMNPIQRPQLPANSALLLTTALNVTQHFWRLVSALRRVFSKFDLNLILFIKPQSITK